MVNLDKLKNKEENEEYYLLSLKNMDVFSTSYGDFDRILNDCFPGIIHEKEENKSLLKTGYKDFYRRMPIIGKELNGIMHDFVTGIEIEDKPCAGLQYISKTKIPKETVIYLFKGLEEEDIKRYMNALSHLYQKSVQRYENAKKKIKQ